MSTMLDEPTETAPHTPLVFTVSFAAVLDGRGAINGTFALFLAQLQ